MRILFGFPGWGWSMWGLASFKPGRMWFVGFSRALPKDDSDRVRPGRELDELKEWNEQLARALTKLTIERGECDDELDRLKKQNAKLTKACSLQQETIQQTLGRALGYPRLCDDQKAFPGCTDADGVCVGDHVAETLAEEAAKAITRLRALEAAAIKAVEAQRAPRFYEFALAMDELTAACGRSR